MPPLELPVQSNPGRYGADGAVRLINCYAEERGREGKIPFPLYCSDGLPLFATVTGGGSCRGLLATSSALYGVFGAIVAKIDTLGNVTILGGFVGTGPVFMAINQKTTPQIVIVGDGLISYIESDVLSPIEDEDLNPPNSVVSYNQRFIATTNSGRAQYSGLLAITFGANDFVTAEYAPDTVNRGFVRRGELLLFGTQTIEPWYNPDSGDNVLLRSGSVIERGCLNGATVAMLEETPVFVADDGTVRILNGYQTQQISTHAVEKSIQDTTDKTALRAFVYQKDGHSFYILSGTDFTWIFDGRSGFWHEKQSYGLSRWRAQSYAKFNGQHVVGDYLNGNLYTISEDTFDEDGNHLVMTIQVPINAFPRKIRLDELRIDPIPGVGLNSSDEHDANPKLMVSLSKNGGKTFGNERQVSIGRIGEYYRQVRLNRLGTSNEDGFVIRISASAAVVRAITGLSAEYQILRH